MSGAVPEGPAAHERSQDAPERQRFGLADLVVAIVIGFLFAVSLWGALGNLIGVPQAYPGHVPWVSLVAAVVAPALLFAGALVLGRGRTTLARTLILIAAIAANSAVGLSLYFVSLSALPVS